MGDKSKIEWTDATWNPVVGCSKVSPGCDNCYAISMSRRIEATGNEAYQGTTTEDDWTGLVKTLPERLDQPLRWRRPRRVFVNSMSDLFHPDVPYDFLWQVFAVMGMAREHQFQVLTKRPQRMGVLGDKLSYGRVWRAARDLGLEGVEERFDPDLRDDDGWPLPNVWLGTSIEDNKYAFRANFLRYTPAAIRFLSLEPLLGPLDQLDLDGIDWVIVGGESGPGARPMHPDWVRDIRDRCVEAGVAFFFKQWGAYGPQFDQDGQPLTYLHQGRLETWPEEPPAGTDRNAAMLLVGKKAAGRELDGRTWDEYPNMAKAR